MFVVEEQMDFLLNLLFCLLEIKTTSIQGFLFGEKYLHLRKMTAEDKERDEKKTSIEENFLSNKPRHSLARENQVLQLQVTESQKVVEMLRSHLAAVSSNAGFSTAFEREGDNAKDAINEDDTEDEADRFSASFKDSKTDKSERKSMESVRNPLIYSSLEWEKM